jgi:tetratricopeptide (TPR) repeat protein/DNA-binding winged helix-turn-helix (wHTH) protein
MSSRPPFSPEEVCFGHFSVNLRSGELRKNDVRIKLQTRPLQILEILLERPGEVVTREDLKSRLWPDDTFVDFDHSISSAVRKLRDALCDSASAPRYVETVGRGYRFIHPVERRVRQSTAINSPASRLSTEPSFAERTKLVPADEIVVSRHKRLWVWAIAGIAGLGLALTTAAFIRTQTASRMITSSDRVVLADIENRTGNPAFDGTLLQAMRLKLNESPYFTWVPDTEFRAKLKQQSGSVRGATSLENARASCRDLGAKAVLGGSISSDTLPSYELRLDALRCADGRVLATEKVRSVAMEQVLPTVGQLTDDMRRRLGEPTELIDQFRTPITQATTASVAALKAFAEGEAKRAEGKDYDAIPLYKIAVDLDPGFALAYGRLGTIYANAQEIDASEAYFQKAFDHRERSTERERLYLTAHYYGSTGDLQKVVEAYQLWCEIYPRDVVPWNNLGDIYLVLGQPEKAVDSIREAFRLKPDNGIIRETLAQAYQRSGRFDDAKKLYEDTVARNLDGVHIRFVRYIIAFAENDSAEMQRQLDWAHGNEREGEMLDRAGWGAATDGELAHAHSFFMRAHDTAIKHGLLEFAAAVMLDDAQMEADVGFVAGAKTSLAKSLRINSKSATVLAFAGLVSARIGELHQAEEFTNRLAQKAPEDTVMMELMVPTVRGLIALQRKRPADALEQLQKVEAYDLSRMTELATTYYRGLAYKDNRKLDKAVETFQKIIDHRMVAPNSPYVPLAHLELGRTHRLAGDMNRARQEYEAFFAAWRNADKDVPSFREAQSEYSRLAVARK